MKKMFKLLIFYLAIIFLTIGTIPLISISADNSIPKLPLDDTVDLLINGSIPIRINLTKDFDFVTRIIIELDYDDPNYLGSNFAAAGPLTNGFCFCLEGESYFDFNITANDDFTHMSYDTTVFKDDKNPKVTHVYSRLSFWKIAPPYGLAITSNDSLFFIVQDDMTAAALAIIDFEINVQGFKFVTDIPAESFTDDLFIIEFLNNLALYLVQYWFIIVAVSAIVIVVIKVLFF